MKAGCETVLKLHLRLRAAPSTGTVPSLREVAFSQTTPLSTSSFAEFRRHEDGCRDP